ncbi:MAG: hypothetical protein CRU78_08255 [Candidatus Accumulibacter phosphatis]|uniref:Insertion element IS402-like domain-containing protein n=1 Tax=Candidatus Accumulibacter phosphatis TaxID=327160 RepID=A0A6A7RT67_9PROT|nr:hypothetical protein [Candidatus Accumulibacter phosphatis]
MDNRRFVEAVLWIAPTGSPWRDLPSEFGPWKSVYQRSCRWSRRGEWHPSSPRTSRALSAQSRAPVAIATVDFSYNVTSYLLRA